MKEFPRANIDRKLLRFSEERPFGRTCCKQRSLHRLEFFAQFWKIFSISNFTSLELKKLFSSGHFEMKIFEFFAFLLMSYFGDFSIAFFFFSYFKAVTLIFTELHNYFKALIEGNGYYESTDGSTVSKIFSILYFYASKFHLRQIWAENASL